MRILLTGADGQLGLALQASCPKDVKLTACSRSHLDITDAAACDQIIGALQPAWVINAAAYTAVDRAEHDSQRAYAVNALAPAHLVAALARYPGRLLQISTDFVFSGLQGIPYATDQPTDPISVYGSSKAAGEQVTLAYEGGYVLRTSWLHGPVGRNFPLTMLRLHRERSAMKQPLTVVTDQVATPTSTRSLAEACWRLVRLNDAETSFKRILHWSDAGVASWYDVAVAVGELAVEAGLLSQSAAVLPIRSCDYPAAAARPAFSVLDCHSTREALDLSPLHWRESLRISLEELRCGQP